MPGSGVTWPSRCCLSAMSRDPERRERFQREARAIAALNHPHICAIHDVGEQDGMDFLVMELLDGESLAERLARGPLPYRRRRADCLCRARRARGRARARHRAPRPEAREHLPDAARRQAARLRSGARGAEHADTRRDRDITREDVVLGSPRYMAPEQLRGGAVDHRTDLFAAAVVIYEMLAGRPPFDGRTTIELAHAIAL